MASTSALSSIFHQSVQSGANALKSFKMSSFLQGAAMQAVNDAANVENNIYDLNNVQLTRDKKQLILDQINSEIIKTEKDNEDLKKYFDIYDLFSKKIDQQTKSISTRPFFLTTTARSQQNGITNNRRRMTQKVISEGMSNVKLLLSQKKSQITEKEKLKKLNNMVQRGLAGQKEREEIIYPNFEKDIDIEIQLSAYIIDILSKYGLGIFLGVDWKETLYKNLDGSQMRKNRIGILKNKSNTLELIKRLNNQIRTEKLKDPKKKNSNLNSRINRMSSNRRMAMNRLTGQSIKFIHKSGKTIVIDKDIEQKLEELYQRIIKKNNYLVKIYSKFEFRIKNFQDQHMQQVEDYLTNTVTKIAVNSTESGIAIGSALISLILTGNTIPIEQLNEFKHHILSSADSYAASINEQGHNMGLKEDITSGSNIVNSGITYFGNRISGMLTKQRNNKPLKKKSQSRRSISPQAAEVEAKIGERASQLEPAIGFSSHISHAQSSLHSLFNPTA
jgi:hypothetical protein